MQTLSIIIPCYNEEQTIKVIIGRIKNIKINLKKEIIVVDDGSTDNSLNLLKSIKGITLISHDINQGKGAAIRTGLKKASGDIILIQDADLEYDPEDIPKLLEPILDNESKVVYGSRFLEKKFKIFDKNRIIYPSHLIGNKILSMFTTILYFQKITDMETGYKLFVNSAIKNLNLKANGFDIEPEITAKIKKSGYNILEIPINFKPRLIEEGKKITWKDGVKALWYLFKYRLFD